MESSPGLRVKDLNCGKRPGTLKSLLNTTDPKKWDVLCIQEPPHFIDELISYRSQHWHLFLPSKTANKTNNELYRSVIYVNKTIPLNSYTQIPVNSLDITAITFRFPDVSFCLFSIYNPPSTTATIDSLETHLRRNPPHIPIILSGDFNLHHPLWSGPRSPKRSQRSHTEPLIHLLSELDLTLCLPPSTPTFLSDAHKTWSTLDLVFASADIADLVIKCAASDGHGSDHRAVDVVIDINTPSNPQIARYNWRETDWEEYGKTLTDLLAEQDFAVKSRSANSPESIDAAALILSECMKGAASQAVPVSKPSPFTKRWWTKDLSVQLKELKTIQNRAAKRTSTPAERAAVAPARRAYHTAIRKQQRRHWRTWLEEATDRTVWQANKYVTQEPGSATASRTPDLQGPNGLATTNEEKSDTLLHTFFPPPPPADLGDTDNFEYPEPLESQVITEREVEEAIEALSPYKAPGPNTIPNIAIKSSCDIFLTPLTHLFNACLDVGHQPAHWKIFTTITLRKPQKPDYSLPKAYRPIALEDTVGKVMESVIARRLSALAERFDLLPANHFGGRPGRTTTDAVLYLVQRIKDAWRQKGVLSVLFLDISQAFPSVSHTRLIHNLQKRRTPTNLTTWITSFLSDRTTKLQFDDFTSDPLTASTGIPQGSPMSPILYLFYGADLLEITDPAERDKFTGGYIDDTMLAAVSETAEENIVKLEQMVESAREWSKTHACKFDISKFQLIHFTRNERKRSDEGIKIADHMVLPSETAKYLGIILDRKLRWREQVERAVSVGTSTALAVARLAKSTFGLPSSYTRQLIRSVVQPKMEYGLVVFYNPVRGGGDGKRRKGAVGVAKKLGKVQRLAAKVITGGLRTTATEVLDFHAGLPPIELHLNHSIFNAAARLATLAIQHPLHKYVKRSMTTYPAYHRSPIHEVFNAFPELKNLEKISVTPRDMTSTLR